MEVVASLKTRPTGRLKGSEGCAACSQIHYIRVWGVSGFRGERPLEFRDMRAGRFLTRSIQGVRDW